MLTTCPKCSYTRNAKDDPKIEQEKCPSCGIYYAKYKKQKLQPKKIREANIKISNKINIKKQPEISIEQKLLARSEIAEYKTNHILHLILSAISLGIWLIVWGLISINNTSHRNSIKKQYGLKMESNVLGIILLVFFYNCYYINALKPLTI